MNEWKNDKINREVINIGDVIHVPAAGHLVAFTMRVAAISLKEVHNLSPTNPHTLRVRGKSVENADYGREIDWYPEFEQATSTDERRPRVLSRPITSIHEVCDAVGRERGCFQPGNTEIWYMKSDSWVRKNSPGGLPVDPGNLAASHAMLGRISGWSCIEQVFSEMQGERWAPYGQANALLAKIGVGHTSMSVGDIVRMPHGGLWRCDSIGWSVLDKPVVLGFMGTILKGGAQ